MAPYVPINHTSVKFIITLSLLLFSFPQAACTLVNLKIGLAVKRLVSAVGSLLLSTYICLFRYQALSLLWHKLHRFLSIRCVL